MLFGIILGVTVFATFAMYVREGLWSNSLSLIQITLSGLVAFGLYQPLTILVDEQTDGGYTYLLDYIMLWAVYSVTLIILKVLFELLSKKKLKFVPPQVDDIAGPAMGLLCGVILAGFVGATLHTAPLPRDGLGGAMDYTKQQIGSAPVYALDITWLNLVEAASGAGLASGEEFSAEQYITRYALRREKYSKLDSLTVQRAGG